MPKSSEVWKIIKKFSVMLAVLVAGDQFAGLLLDYIREHSPDGRYFKARYSLERCHEDIVILGSSRGEINYVPRIIEDSLGLSCWNASRGGQEMPYFRCIQEGILKRYAPKIVIINVEPYLFEYDLDTSYERTGFLRPFYNKHPEIRPILNQISRAEKWFIKSRLYAYNSSFYYLIRPYFFPNIDGKVKDKGWKPKPDAMNPELITETEDIQISRPLISQTVHEFEVLIKKFKENNTKVFLVISPDYGRRVQTSSTIKYLKSFTREHEIPLFIHSADEALISHSEYFTDPDHLNVQGALIFTQRLCKEMKPYLKEVTGKTIFTKFSSN